jgi:hypothetical protein
MTITFRDDFKDDIYKSPLKSPIEGIARQFLFCHPESALLGWLGKVPAVTANLASRRCLDSSTASTTPPLGKKPFVFRFFRL